MSTTKDAAEAALATLVEIMQDLDTYPDGIRLEAAREILKYEVNSR